MKYDFETLVNRHNTGACKYEHMLIANPNVGDNIVPLSIADMELKNPPEVIGALKEYLDDCILGYTNPTKNYLEAVCGWMNRRHNWEVEPEWIYTAPGVVPALYTCVKAYTNPGDNIIIMTPIYYPFYGAVEGNGRKILRNSLIDTDDDYEIDFKDLESKAKDPNTKMLLLCSPHNPVGRVWTKEELEKIGRICIDNNVLVISDEIHFDLVMPGYKHTVFATISKEFEQNSVICTAPSKTFNLAGLQTSNIIIPNKELRDIYIKEQDSTGLYIINNMGYIACQAAYTKCEEWLEELIVLIDKNRNFVESFIKEKLPMLKVRKMEGTYLLWIDFKGLGVSHEELAEFMVNEANVFLDEGSCFGEEGNGFERINLACPTWVLEEMLERLLGAIEKRFLVGVGGN